MPHPSLLTSLAHAFLTAGLNIDDLTEQAKRTLGRQWLWLRPLAQRYVARFAGRTRPRHRDVVRFLLEDAGFERVRSKSSSHLVVEQYLAGPQRMQPVAAAEGWDIAVIESSGALADWFWLEPGQLAWFADLKGLGYKNHAPQLHHYRYKVLPKRPGSFRLIEAPKSRLKRLQRQILTWILDKIPPHPAAHGFLQGRSIRTFVSPHVGRRVVLRMDLQDFFPAIRAARIQTIFRTMGYPELVADLLGGICTNATPRDIWTQPGLEIDRLNLCDLRTLYSRPHLPQGAPTSPALANLCAYRMDCRLSGLAEKAGAVYSRYADDLAFSGDDEFARGVERFSTHVAAILLEEGFPVTIARHASCARACGSTWPVWLPINESTSTATISIA